MPIDAILLGMVIIGFIVSVPVCVGIVGVLLWGNRPHGRRRALTR